MQNIDLFVLLEPAVVLAFSAGLVLYWHYRHSFTKHVLLYSLLAYAGAIAAKILLQAFTYNPVSSAFGSASPITGFYLAVQTMAFEVGFAYLIAIYAVKHCKMTGNEAEGYGIGLAFWENGIYLGIFPIISIVAIYSILASGLPSANQIYSTLLVSSPQYFYSPAQLLPNIGWALLERVSSLLVHVSWGFLCVFAAFFHRKSYFLIALPMGFIDFFTIFANELTIPIFEIIIFALSAGFLTLTLLITEDDRKKLKKSG